MRTPLAARVSVAAITLLAFALRVYHLDGQSLWYDEGFSVYLAQMSMGEITARTAADIQPPVYYYLLHGWMLALGRSEVALRLLSAVFGVLTVPLVFLLARRLLGAGAGLLAALLIAVSPFHVWYAQEARMYTLVTMLGVLSSWLALRLAGDDAARRAGRPALWAAYALTNVVAVYTHYYAFFLVAFQALYLLAAWLWRGRPRRLAAAAAAALLATLLAYAPWAGFALNRYAVDESYWQGALSLDFVRKTLLAFSAGQTVFEAQAQVFAAGYVLLAALGVAWLLRRAGGGIAPDRSAIFLLLYLVVPFILLYLFSAWRPKFNPRYLMLASPPFFVLVAAGVAALAGVRRSLWRAAAVLGLLFVLATSGYALANNYANRVYVRDDFRSVARRIAEARQTDEAVVLSSGHLFPVYEYYTPGADAYRIPDIATLSTKAVVTYDVADKLNAIAAAHGGVWLVLWQNDVVDPAGILTRLLDAQAERVPEPNIYWGIELRHYRLRQGVRFAAPEMAATLNVNYDGKLVLAGVSPARQDVTAGDTVALTLYWQAQQPLYDDYWLALRLVDPAGRVVGALNERPAGYGYPTTRWQPQTTTPGSYHLPVPPALAPGDYTLQAIIFSPARGQNLSVLDGRGAPAGISANVGTVTVRQPAQPPAAESLGLARVLRLPLSADMELLATSLGEQSVRQGETLSFAVAWRNNAQTAKDYRARLRLVAGATLLSETAVPLAATDYPASRWPAGSVVRSQYELTVPANAPAQIDVQVALDGSAPQTIARLAVTPVARSTAVPAMQHALQAQFGVQATLLGYDLSAATAKPGQTLDLTLYWQAGAQAGQGPAYTVFTHLLGADHVIYAQHDSPPAGGARPTTGWLAGEVVTDRHALTLKPDTPAGEYVLEIGLYDPMTERRLSSGGDGQAADHIILPTRVRVER